MRPAAAVCWGLSRSSAQLRVTGSSTNAPVGCSERTEGRELAGGDSAAMSRLVDKIGCLVKHARQPWLGRLSLPQTGGCARRQGRKNEQCVCYASVARGRARGDRGCAQRTKRGRPAHGEAERTNSHMISLRIIFAYKSNVGVHSGISPCVCGRVCDPNGRRL